MAYQLSLKLRHIIGIGLLLMFLGFLLFVAGVFTGVRMAGRVAKGGEKKPVAAPAAVAAPKAEAENLAKVVKVPPEVAAPKEGAEDAKEGKSPGKDAKAKPGERESPGKEAEAAGDKPAPGEDAAQDKAAELEKVAYCVQVGAFLAKFSADEQLAVLKKLGYKATIKEFRDSDSRLWYSVRMGQYAREKDAFKAASEFSRKEKMYAEVRMIDSL